MSTAEFDVGINPVMDNRWPDGSLGLYADFTLPLPRVTEKHFTRTQKLVKLIYSRNSQFMTTA